MQCKVAWKSVKIVQKVAWKSVIERRAISCKVTCGHTKAPYMKIW